MRISPLSAFALTVLLMIAVPCIAGAPADANQNPQSPQAVLQALMSAFTRHDFAAIDQLIAPQGIYEDFAARFRGVGPAQVKDFLRGVIQVEPDFEWHLTNAVESGATVAAE